MNGKNFLKKRKTFKLLLLALLIIGIFFINEDNLETLFSLNKNKKNIELITSMDVPKNSDVNIYIGNIAIYKDRKLSIFDLEGNLKAERKFDFKNPSIQFGQNYIYVGNKDTGDIYKLDLSAEILSILDFDKPLFNVYEKNGNTLYHTKSDSSESVYIYNSDDSLAVEHSFIGKNILDYEIKNIDKGYVISTLNLNKGNLKSNIVFYDGNNKIDASLDIEGEIILQSKFINKKEMAILTDKSLYCIKKNKALWNQTFNLIKDIYIKENIHVLHSNYLETIDFNGGTISSIGFDRNYENIIGLGEDILVYGKNGFSLISDSQEILQYRGDIDLLRSSEKNLTILKDNKLDIYKVVEI